MGFYSHYIFPRLIERTLSSRQIQAIRTAVLADVYGSVCEIGFGTGLNLPHYPSHIKQITTVDVNPGTFRLAEPRIAASSIKVVHQTLNGERLPFADAAFDAVVCTFTLCSIRNVHQALAEMRRILAPAGQLHFVEHGLAPELRVQWWQHKLTPLIRRIGEGCHLNRDTGAMLDAGGFRILRMEHSYLKSVPRVGGYLSYGVAAP
jgi:ubiquinone/menaquinone biosynthesis C-methylase UbiE